MNRKSKVYINLWRGINVGGHKAIKMEDLKNLYRSLGFDGVRSYLNSGNLLFTCPQTEKQHLENRISKAFQKAFGYPNSHLLLESEELINIQSQNPLLSPERQEDDMHLSFLASPSEKWHKEAINVKMQEGEAWAYTPSALYLYCPNGYGKTKLHNGFLEKTLGVMITTRNLRTVKALVQISFTM